MKKLFLLLFSVLAFTSQVRADVEWSIWVGENTDNVYIPKDLVAKMEVGDKIIVNFTQKDNEQDGELLINWNTIAYKYMAEGYTDYFDYTNNIVTITITETLKNQVAGTTAYTKYYWDNEWKTEEVTQAGDLRIKANGSLIFTSIVLKKQKSFIVKSYDVTASIGNYSDGTNVYPQGLTSDDYLYFNATTNNLAEYWQAQLGDLGIIGVVGGFWFPVTTYYNTINTSGAYLNGYYINVTGMKQYHPVNSFKIGSIGMATFSANQKVKVPEGLTAYKAKVSGNNVTLTPFTDNIIPADQGAIIKGPQGSVVEFAATSEASVDESDLKAVTTETDVTTLADEGFELYVLSASEKEDPLDLSDLLSGIEDWGGKVNVSTAEPYTAQWTSLSTGSSMGKWLGKNWSSYDKLRLVFTSNSVTENVHFGISYDGHNGEDTGADLAPEQLTVDIPLKKSYRNAIAHFYFYSIAKGGSLTFESATLIDNDGGDVAMFRKTTSGNIAANKAYLKIPTGTPSKLNIVFAEDEDKQGEEQQGETNSIRNIANTNVNNNVVYNMNGQRVGSDYKGIVIVNGKKIIKK